MAGEFDRSSGQELLQLERGPELIEPEFESDENSSEQDETSNVDRRTRCKRAILVSTVVASAACAFIAASYAHFGPVDANVRASTILENKQKICERPSGWCTGANNLIFWTGDCDGDGEADPFCQKTDSKTGDTSCGCLQSSNQCTEIWPTACPLDLKPGQSGIDAGTSASGSAWWWLLLLLLLCLLCCLLLLLCSRKEKEPEREDSYTPMVENTPPEPQTVEPLRPAPVEEPQIVEPPRPAPVEEPQSVEPPRPAPVSKKPQEPEGVPIWFRRPLGFEFESDMGVPYYCQYRPLGIDFYKNAPIKIDSFKPDCNSYGKQLLSWPDKRPLEKGMIMTKLRLKKDGRTQDIDVRQDTSFEDVNKALQEALAPLPLWPLCVDFQDPRSGEIKSFKFLERPLGIRFSRKAPIVVDEIKQGSLAEESNVQKGWKIVRIGNEDVSGMTSYNPVGRMLFTGLKYLPTRLQTSTSSQRELSPSTSNRGRSASTSSLQ